KETAHKEYVYHYLRADVNALMNELQGGTMAHLTKDTMEKRTIIMPENAEQKAIADVLTNMDAEIEALEQKLAKYRQVKQGMMQQLLTGKIRLV
ncbi:MAG: restriction endonuclease subunit S, partial [Tyzzerella sp.]|nr:restriction endonuclease subunit S [Tyzzerella sp.]